MCSIKFFEVYKGKYLGDVLGYADKGPLIDKCIFRISYFGYTIHATNSLDESIMRYSNLINEMCSGVYKWGDNIKTVEEFFKITKIDFEDII